MKSIWQFLRNQEGRTEEALKDLTCFKLSLSLGRTLVHDLTKTGPPIFRFMEVYDGPQKSSFILIFTCSLIFEMSVISVSSMFFFFNLFSVLSVNSRDCL